MTGPTAANIHDMRVWGGNLIVSGGFRLVADQDHWETHFGISAWDGSHWSPLASGLNGRFAYLGEYQGDLIAAGYGVSVPGTSITNIARWNGSTWSPLGTGAPFLIYAVAEFLGDLYVGADFDGVMRWNGASWSAVPGYGSVSALAVSGGRLIVGGQFSDPVIPSPNVAFWDGSSWQAAGAGVDGVVYAATDWLGQPVIGGDLNASGLTPLTGVAMWDGAAWQPMGTRAVLVQVLRVVEGELLASGSFRLPDASIVNTIARWDGTDWHVLGSGAIDYEYANHSFAFASYGGHLYHAGTGRVHGQPAHTMVRAPLGAVLDVPRPGATGTRVVLRASPNPSRSHARFTFHLSAAGRTRLTVVDVAGRVVATLADGPFGPGEHEARWEAPASPGIYFAKLEGPNGVRAVTRLVRLD